MFVDNITTSNQICKPFLRKIVDKGKSKFTTANSIQKMCQNWKITGKFKERGRPSIMSVEEVVKITNQLLKTRSSNSNTFKLKQHKNMIVHKKKEMVEVDGLDPDTITSTVTTE